MLDYMINAGKLAAFLFIIYIASLGAEPFQLSPKFQTEQAAQQHCPNDTVVWVNTQTGVFHFKGQRWYGNTKNGAYECRKEGELEGGRATRNGQ